MNPLDNIHIVLVNPINPGNVGAVCRCMANCGISHLVIAEGSHTIDTEECRKRAMHAESIFLQRQEFATLPEAIADCSVIAGTSAREGLYRAHSQTIRQWAPTLFELAANNQLAIIFGTEDKGLRNEHLALCTHIIQIPSHPDYTSLNLSHAVMICCYELFLAADIFQPSEEPSELASSSIRERMFAAWRDTLLDIGFMNDEKADHMMMGIRRIFARGALTESDMKILMGMARQSQWSALQLKRLNQSDTNLQKGIDNEIQ